MANLQRNKEYILSLIGEPEERVEVNRKAVIENEFGSDESGAAKSRGDIIAQTAAIIGVGAALSLLDSATQKTSKQRKNEIEDANTKALQSRDKNASVDISSRVTTHVDEIKAKVDQYGLNYLNRWIVDYGDNLSLAEGKTEMDKLKELMSVYTIEMSLPTIEITTSKNSLSFISNEDVSDLNNGDISVTIMLDQNMKIYNAVHNIVDKIRNPLTGRYGYKDDYKFKYIDVYINDEVGNKPFYFRFTECVLKGISELTLTYGQSDIKSISLTFSYDRKLKETDIVQ